MLTRTTKSAWLINRVSKASSVLGVPGSGVLVHDIGLGFAAANFSANSLFRNRTTSCCLVNDDSRTRALLGRPPSPGRGGRGCPVFRVTCRKCDSSTRSLLKRA